MHAFNTALVERDTETQGERERMERDQGGFKRDRGHAKSSSDLSFLGANIDPSNITLAPNAGAAATNNESTRPSGPSVVREQDQYMPIANVIRIMRRILPAHAKISDDAKETIQECVSEYISFITGEANDRCQREQRKTVTAEDVLWAMGKLGFDDYVEPLTIYLNRYRESESDRTRLDFVPRRFGTVAPAYGQASSHVGQIPGMFDGAPAMSGPRGSGSGGASSSSGNAPAGFDPYANFK